MLYVMRCDNVAKFGSCYKLGKFNWLQKACKHEAYTRPYGAKSSAMIISLVPHSLVVVLDMTVLEASAGETTMLATRDIRADSIVLAFRCATTSD